MKLLLDTQALLWFLQNSAELPADVRARIEDPNNDVSVCVASYWEIGIKQKIKQAEMPWTAGVPALEHLALAEDITTLPITTDAIEHTKRLTLDHRDPFDRIIAASAITSGMHLVSSDPQMDLFVKDRLW